jgi:hypothetical protein
MRLLMLLIQVTRRRLFVGRRSKYVATQWQDHKPPTTAITFELYGVLVHIPSNTRPERGCLSPVGFLHSNLRKPRKTRKTRQPLWNPYEVCTTLAVSSSTPTTFHKSDSRFLHKGLQWFIVIQIREGHVGQAYQGYEGRAIISSTEIESLCLTAGHTKNK